MKMEVPMKPFLAIRVVILRHIRFFKMEKKQETVLQIIAMMMTSIKKIQNQRNIKDGGQ